jgi:hypothetical protein
MDIDIAYDWLWVWVNATPKFPKLHHWYLWHFSWWIESRHRENYWRNDNDNWSRYYWHFISIGCQDEENSEGMCIIDHEAASPYTIHTAVLPKPSLINENVNSAITAMLDIVQPKNDYVNKDATYDKVLPHEKYAQNQPIIPVSHESNEPIVEWTDNKTLLTGAFLDNFFWSRCSYRIANSTKLETFFSLLWWSIRWSFIHCSRFQSIAACMLHL